MAHLPEGRLETRLPDKKPRYAHAEAVAEANRCLYCSDAPCTAKCPTGIDVPTFIHKIATDNVRGAARTIFAENLLGASCARVCPVEVLCEGACVVGEWGREPIAIGRLQRYATETALALDPALVSRTRKERTGKRVALVGAGPASLAAAGHLALEGHTCVLYEHKDVPGGLNVLGIAPYKMHANDGLAEVRFVEALGDVEVRTGVRVVAGAARPGEVSAEALLSEHDAVFLGIGLGSDKGLGIPGEEGPGVVGATALVERIKRDPALSLAQVRRAAVVGGGNTAIDVARELAQLGVPEVVMVYRKTAAQMPGYAHELEGARKDGVRLLEARQPVEVLRDAEGSVRGLRLSRTEGGRPVPGHDEELACDLVALAIGQARLTELARAFPGVALDALGRVVVDEATCRTGNPKVFAGGDCVNGGEEVVNAAQHGKLAARAIGALLASRG